MLIYTYIYNEFRKDNHGDLPPAKQKLLDSLINDPVRKLAYDVKSMREVKMTTIQVRSASYIRRNIARIDLHPVEATISINLDASRKF